MSGVSADLGAAVDRLRRGGRILVTCHRSPDGDAIGSELALAELAEALGAVVTIVNRDAAPAGLAELPGSERILIAEQLPPDFPTAYDLVITVECPGLDRTGFDRLVERPILNLDHHRSNESYGELNVVDESAPAVGEMVWRMFDVAGVTPSAAAAMNAFVALSTDTGDFRYASATARAFRTAAEMVAGGADPVLAAEWVHQRRSAGSVRLLGEALRTMTFECDDRLVTIAVDTAAFARAGARPEDTDDLINAPRAITGVEVVVFLKQSQPGVVRVSLRSKGAVDVCVIAEGFGGGGHTNAAGCTLAGDIDSARRQLVGLVAAALATSPPDPGVSPEHPGGS